MKKDNELRPYAESLLKSYKTRRDNIEREFKANGYNYADYYLKIKIYDARIQTVKNILK